MLEDFRYGVRLMFRNPGITAVAILTLALGIGANTAMFSVISAVLLQPLPFADPDRVIHIWATNPSHNIPIAFTSYSRFAEWRTQSRSFSHMSGYTPGSASLTGNGEPERINLLLVNDSYFPLLGVAPALGRNFTAEEDRPGFGKVAVLDHRLWDRRFGRDPKVVGRTILLNGEPYTVVGVAPKGFANVGGPPADMYVPIAQSTAPGVPFTVGAFGRLKPEVPLERAQAEMDTITKRQDTLTMRGWGVRLWRTRDFMVRDVRASLLVLLAAVGLVLLIACANVANVLLVRAGSRQREIAVRIAIGADRGRLVRQLLAESLLLSLSGGVLGALLAWGGVKLVVRFGPVGIPLLTNARIDLAVLSFTAAVSVLTGVLFGLAPALAATRPRVYDTLKEGGRAAADTIHRMRVRGVLVVSEVALALLLLIGASLLVRSLTRLEAVDPGFNPEGVLTASISLPQARYPQPERRVALYRDLRARLEAMPGVAAAGMTSSLPLSGHNQGFGLIAEGQPPPRPGEIPILYGRSVDPGYFKAMRIPLLRGRYLTEADAGKPRVAVVNETLARRFWPDKDPIGKRFGNGRDWTTVVGVVADTRHMSLAQPAGPDFFEPYAQSPRNDMVLTVRTASDPARFSPALRRAVQELDRELPVTEAGSMTERVSVSKGSRRFAAWLLASLAGIALVLAVVGIYGVISYSVARRTQEIGVRMALGAHRADVIRMVVRQAAALAVGGVAIGLAGGFALTRFLRSMLYGVTTTDPAVFTLAPLVLTAVALIASYVPALRAASVAPSRALRYE